MLVSPSRGVVRGAVALLVLDVHVARVLCCDAVRYKKGSKNTQFKRRWFELKGPLVTVCDPTAPPCGRIALASSLPRDLPPSLVNC